MLKGYESELNDGAVVQGMIYRFISVVLFSISLTCVYRIVRSERDYTPFLPFLLSGIIVIFGIALELGIVVIGTLLFHFFTS
jgi:hypothetical protein